MQSKANNKQNKKMRLWNPTEGISNTILHEGDEYAISEQFFRKINCIKNNKMYKPDISKDCLLSNYYSFDSFDFYEFCNNKHCIETLKCTRLRVQNFELLEYFRNETLLVESLIKLYHVETDEDTKIALKELIKIKKTNLNLVDQIRGCIVELFEKSQNAALYLEKIFDMIKKDK